MANTSPNRRYERIVRSFLDEPWAIQPSKLEAIAAFIFLKASGGTLSETEIAALRAAAPPPAGGMTDGAVAVLPIFGVLRNRANLLTDISGGTSVEMLSRQFASLVDDPRISAIVLDIDSPGGSVSGIPEFATQIHAARAVKPVVAVANTLAASAAYWLGAAASEFVAAPSAMVGSVGALMVHEDQSAADEKEGRKVTFISAGQYKTEGNPHEPLGDDARAALQSLVDDAYAQFTGDVARFRGVSLEAVQGKPYGAGRVLTARNALASGMVDRVEVIDAAVHRMMSPDGRAQLMRSSRRAVSEYDAPHAGPDVDQLRIAARLDAIEARLSVYESTSEPEAAGLEAIDIEAIAAAFGEHLKERQ